MRKTVLALAAAATVAAGSMMAPPQAEARGGRVAAGVIGGLAAGAILGGAIASRPAYGYYGGGPYGYYDGGPAYVAAPACYIQRERFWDGFGWRVRRVRVCD